MREEIPIRIQNTITFGILTTFGSVVENGNLWIEGLHGCVPNERVMNKMNREKTRII